MARCEARSLRISVGDPSGNGIAADSARTGDPPRPGEPEEAMPRRCLMSGAKVRGVGRGRGMVEEMRAASWRSPVRPCRMIVYYNRQRPQTAGHGGQEDEGRPEEHLG